MSSFESVHNWNEKVTYRVIRERAPQFADLSSNPGLLADVACVALNRLPARYVRSDIDLVFYMSEEALVRHQAEVENAVDFAVTFVRAHANR